MYMYMYTYMYTTVAVHRQDSMRLAGTNAVLYTCTCTLYIITGTATNLLAKDMYELYLHVADY